MALGRRRPPRVGKDGGGQKPSRGVASLLCVASQTGEWGLLPESSGRPRRAPSGELWGGR